MNALDWVIIINYLSGRIGLSVYLGKSQSSEEDYFVGERILSWWPVGVYTMPRRHLPSALFRFRPL